MAQIDSNYKAKQFVSPIVTTDYSAESSLLSPSVQSRYVDMKPIMQDSIPNKLKMHQSFGL